ncbi:MAG: hypothetical protein KME10_00115 [Plectolyngbya sp. WJT66-NPBG17]|nr:hypothetical protein [Plectolyngbya sp. WJT66-NPBG17]MBW4523582.1 hypothetical protein [Phormidium tanganyikae FI6-MK23]
MPISLSYPVECVAASPSKLTQIYGFVQEVYSGATAWTHTGKQNDDRTSSTE